MRYHYAKPTTSVYAPSRIVSVCADIVLAGSPIDANTHAVACGSIYTAASHFSRGRWRDLGNQCFTSGDAFHSWLESESPQRRRTYVFAPIASTVLTLSGFWDRITTAGACWARHKNLKDATPGTEPGGRRYQFETLVLRGKPDIVKYTVDGRGITWLSALQYLQLSDEELRQCAASTNETGSDTFSGVVTRLRLGPDACSLWLRWLKRLCDWWRNVRGGPWGNSAGQLSMMFFRQRLVAKTVLVHGNPEARAIEKLAAFGGRATTWCLAPVVTTAALSRIRECPYTGGRYSPIQGPSNHLDVRSMYPWILATQTFPTRLLSVYHGLSLKLVTEFLRDYCVIATCVVSARRAEYPYRNGDRITYPVGRFTTALCGQELARAISDGEVECCPTVCVYVRGRPFAAMSQSLIDMRNEYRKSGDRTWEAFVKLLSNSFGGKLNQRKYQWERRPDKPPLMDWGCWPERDATTGVTRQFMAVGGLTLERVDSEGTSRPLGSCFAYLTMYGRYRMREIRESLPPQSVISQDTDGLWVTSEAYIRILRDGRYIGEAAGSLREVLAAEMAVFYGPKHYWFDGKWVLSGFHSPIRVADGITFTDTYTVNPVLGACDAAPNRVYYHERTSRLQSAHVDGVVDAFGWVHPRLIPSGSSPTGSIP